MRPVCLVEVGTLDAHLNPRLTRYNIAPMPSWSCFYDYENETWDKWQYKNEERLRFLADLPPDLRGVHFDGWFGNTKLDPSDGLKNAERCRNVLTELFPRDAKPVRVVFTDNEEEQVSSGRLKGLLKPLAVKAVFTCNFNRATDGYAWWGRVKGGAAGASCQQTYEVVDQPAFDKWKDSLELNQKNPLGTVVHLSPCAYQLPSGKWEQVSPAIALEYTRKVVSHALSKGVNTFVLAEYKCRGADGTDYTQDMLDCVSEALRVGRG